MQMHSLAAFSPLFPITGKSNYAQSVVFFLESVQRNVGQKELLKHICSVNLTREGCYFGFDQALEYYGVHYSKENITGQSTDLDNLMLQLQSVQTEHERLEPLITEFVEESRIKKKGKEKYPPKSRKDDLWLVVNELVEAFDLPDPTVHDFFKKAKRINEEGFNKMFGCYEKGLKRLGDLLKQEVYKKEQRITVGRRKKEVDPVSVIEHYKYVKLFNNEENERMKEVEESLPIVSEDTSTLDNERGSLSLTTKKHQKTAEEIEILKEVLNYPVDLPKEVSKRLYEELLKLHSSWTPTKVRSYWYDKMKRKK